MIVSSGAQVAPRDAPSICATVTAGPPVIATFLRVEVAVATKPTHWPSGETKTPRSAAARGDRSRLELIERTDKELRAVIADVDHPRAVRGDRDARSAPLIVNAAVPAGAIVKRSTRGGAGRVANHTERPRRRADHQRAGRQCRDAPPQRSAWQRRCRRRAGGRDACLMIEHEERRSDVGDPLAAILDEAPLQQRADWLRHVGRERLPVRFEADHRAEHLRHVLAIEGAPARQHLVEHAAERPDVAPLVRRRVPSPAPGACTRPCRGSRPRRSSSRAT